MRVSAGFALCKLSISRRTARGLVLYCDVVGWRRGSLTLVKVDLGNIGEFAKPVDTLIEKISNAIGTVYEPRYIKKIAEAEAAAEIIRTQGKIEKTELQQRAAIRLLKEETRKQLNIESIASRALPFVEETAQPENIEDDWIAHFFDRCRLVSDEHMQELWGKILAGKANNPGRFPKRTVEIVATLEKSDAMLFTTLMRFAVRNHGEILPVIFDQVDNPIYHSNGLNFARVSHLQSMGLLHFSSVGGFMREGNWKQIELSYFNSKLTLTFKEPKGNKWQFGNVMLTQAGHDLAPLCEPTPAAGYPEYLSANWAKFGIETEIVFV